MVAIYEQAFSGCSNVEVMNLEASDLEIFEDVFYYLKVGSIIYVTNEALRNKLDSSMYINTS